MGPVWRRNRQICLPSSCEPIKPGLQRSGIASSPPPCSKTRVAGSLPTIRDLLGWLKRKNRARSSDTFPRNTGRKQPGLPSNNATDVRTDKRFLATCGILDRNHEPTNHISFRFPLRLGNKSFGSASLGIQDLHGRIVTMPATVQILPLPSVAELDRFFADTPLPVSVTDRNHCFVYANEAFCRCLREFAQSITEARRSIYGSTLDEFLEGWSEGEEDTGNECKITIWKARTTKTWTSHPRFGDYDLAVGFPVFDEYEQMIGLGAICLPLDHGQTATYHQRRR
jgi:hypothetical protein